MDNCVMVAGGAMKEYTYQVLTEPKNIDGAAYCHEETAADYWKQMKDDGLKYAVHQYTMGRGPIWMEIEAR